MSRCNHMVRCLSLFNTCRFNFIVTRRVLLEAPSLPQQALRQFLEQLAAAGPDWCTLALLAARDAILQRPPSRAPLLQLVLDACASPTSDTRSKAVRLVANRLFPDPGMAPAIEQAARRRLGAMVPPPTTAAAAAPEAVAEPGAAAEDAQAAAAAGAADAADAQAAEGTEAAAGAAEPVNGQEPSPATGDAAAAATAEGAADGTAAPAAEVKQEAAQEAPAASKVQAQAAAAAAEAAAREVRPQAAAAAAAQGPSAAEAAQLCALYCALCTKKHSLLRHLFEVYAATSGAAAGVARRGGGGGGSGFCSIALACCSQPTCLAGPPFLLPATRQPYFPLSAYAYASQIPLIITPALAPWLQTGAAQPSSATPEAWPRRWVLPPLRCWQWWQTRQLAACRSCCRCCTC